MASEQSEENKKPMAGKVCLVTGATRGIGKGIAVSLGAAGATVYITGRTLESSGDVNNPGSLQDTAKEIEARGGHAVLVRCDHGKDEEIRALFDKIKSEQRGRLDVLVNNAYAGVRSIMENVGKPFWETGIQQWDTINHVGLRNTYLCSVLAADMMVNTKDVREGCPALIVNISSVGGLRYLFSVPYGVGKCAVDRMAADCATELRKHNVAYVSLWPGMVSTEHMTNFATGEEFAEHRTRFTRDKWSLSEAFNNAESVEFSGVCIAKLATDADIMKKTGKILLTSDLAQEYQIVDPVTGRAPSDMRQVSTLLHAGGWTTASTFVPGFVKVPRWIMHLGGNKF